ncbi:CD99 molecule isoform X2 [Cheilinus undulatus]|uniref:CD99 molecule isoform X2 n=1 Tax=Cheilinus undulatus TaxID=241271 RepID=UPI001BD3378F|nr:CD99 molecule isoform X2 [Cheilinus undulatus]
MKFALRIALLLCLVLGTLAQDGGFDLFDALGDDDPTPIPPKPKEPPKQPGNPAGGGGLDLSDFFDDPAPTPEKPKVDVPKTPSKPKDDGGFGFDLEDAIGPEDPKPDKPKPKPKPNPSGGGGSFDDSILSDIGDSGEYKPDGGGAHNPGYDPGYDPHGGADQPQEAGGGQIAGIVSAVGMALLGAASSYFAYQKKKLCFKMQGGQDPEKGRHGGQSDNQVFSNLLRTS